MISKFYRLFKKEVILEFRSNMLMFNVVVFALAVNLLIYYFFNSIDVSTNVYMSIYWIIIIFMIFTGFDNIFRSEFIKNNLKFLLLYYDVSSVLIVKTVFNILLLLISQSIFTLLYFIFNGIVFENIFLFAVYAIAGSVVLNVSTVCTALISSKAGNRYLFFIISLPILFPLIIVLSKIGEILLLDKLLDFKKIMFMIFYALFYFAVALLFSEKILIED